MPEEYYFVQQQLRHHLEQMLGWAPSASASAPDARLAAARYLDGERPIDVLITCNEINDRHGTGVLVRRIFGDGRDLVHLRSSTNYGGQTFGRRAFVLPSAEMTRPQIYQEVSRWLEGVNVRRVICIPYLQQDALMAQAVKDIFDVPLCVYLMDDNNIFGDSITNDVMENLLHSASARIAISDEMKHAYEAKYRYPFYFLPPAVDSALVAKEIKMPSPEAFRNRRGTLVGNIWGQRWLDLLRSTVRGSGIEIDWYCNQGKHSWLDFTSEDIARDGIHLHVALSEEELVSRLSEYCFALLPSGTLDETDDNAGVAALSLPSRIPFIMSAAQTPFIVMGNPNTTSACFVQRFGLGTVCDYEQGSFQEAVSRLAQRDVQVKCRTNAFKLGTIFPSQNLADWIWHTVDTGRPPENAFSTALRTVSDDLRYYVEDCQNNWTVPDYRQLYKALSRLKNIGIKPDWIIDVGASTGIWSEVTSSVFPDAKFLLIDPLLSKYEKRMRSRKVYEDEKFLKVEKVLYSKACTQTLAVSKELYRSTLLTENVQFQPKETLEIETTTLEVLTKEHEIEGSVLLKLDVQGAERFVLEGGKQFIQEYVDIIILELCLNEKIQSGESASFSALLRVLSDLGFQLIDRCGEWRCPDTGILQEFDGLFIKRKCIEKLMRSAE